MKTHDHAGTRRSGREVPYIGVIRTPFKELKNMPIQPVGARDVVGEVVVREEFAAGLRDLDGFSHIYLIYDFHRVRETKLLVTPFMDTVERGVFSTRAPRRPARIGLSIVELLKVEGNKLSIMGVDVLDGTPLFDIKPYIENFDRVEESRGGWMKGSSHEVAARRSDDRFV